jgi:hypothetical protein
VVVANPPYVRYHRHKMDDRTRSAYARVLQGQPDLYIMFLYRALRSWLKPGGRTAFTIPIAVLEADYAERLRSVIAEYKLIEIMDLEPLRKLTFRGVKRQTVILVLENSPPSDDDLVTVGVAGTESYDPNTELIDLNLAISSQIPRKFLNIESYFGAASSVEEE